VERGAVDLLLQNTRLTLDRATGDIHLRAT
jgi:hypothetical protein